MDMFSHLLLLALLLPVHRLMDCTVTFVTDTNIDRSSLLALKSHITSDPHNLLTKYWSNETSVCNWIGVTCDPCSNRVTGLNISNMQFVGTIPPEIGNLSSLVSLDMNENSFYGSIPSSIFNMSCIQVITLTGNALSSKLPIDMCMHSLRNLKTLRISFTKLYGEIPSSLGLCSNLDLLSLYHNNLVGEVPKEIGNLTHLTQLFLGYNRLTGMYIFLYIPIFIFILSSCFVFVDLFSMHALFDFSKLIFFPLFLVIYTLRNLVIDLSARCCFLK